MNPTASFLLLAAVLLAPVHTLPAQTVLTPSGNTVDQVWSGYYYGSEPAPGTSSVVTEQFFTGLGAANAISMQATFYSSDPGYVLAPGYGGSFSVTGVQNSQIGSNFMPFRSVLARGNPPLLLEGAETMVGTVLSSATLSWQSVNLNNLGSITYSLDFSGLEFGYLPAGSLFYVADLDRDNLTYNNEGPLSISTTTPGVTGHFLDYIGQHADVATPAFPTVTWDAGTGTYALTTTGTETGVLTQQFDTTVFLTTQNLTSLTVTSSNNIGGGPGHHLFISAPVVPVPEPSGALLITAAGLAALLCRRKSRRGAL